MVIDLNVNDDHTVSELGSATNYWSGCSCKACS